MKPTRILIPDDRPKENERFFFPRHTEMERRQLPIPQDTSPVSCLGLVFAKARDPISSCDEPVLQARP